MEELITKLISAGNLYLSSFKNADCFIHSLLFCGSIKSSWNISVVKFLLEKLKQELVTSPHNYTDKELKGEKNQVNSHFILPPCSWAKGKRHSRDDLGDLKIVGLKKIIFGFFSSTIFTGLPLTAFLFPYSV